MTLHFGYIEGISRIDTPYFANIAEQEDYFDSHEVVDIDSSFYPPHYLNKIKVDTEEIDLNTNINYLWFEFNNKRYYYFIDSIDYISESVIMLDIAMDTIQTYMFNIKITNGILERKFINRFNNDGTINRNYIRENVSNNLFDNYQYTIHNTLWREWMYFMKTTKAIDAPDGHFIDTFGDISSTVSYMDGNNLKYSLNVPYGIYFSFPYQEEGPTVYPNQIPTVGCLLPETVDAFIIPFKCLRGVNISSDYKITGNYIRSKVRPEGLHSDYYFFSHNVWSYISDIKHNSFTFSLYKNTNPGEGFESEYITQLLDENYYSFIFGDNSYATKYPLHLLKHNIIYTAYWADMNSGARYYNITDDDTMLTKNLYNTIIKNPSPLKLDLKNVPWAEYAARNKNALTSAMISDVGTYGSILGNMQLNGESYSNSLKMIASNDKYWDKRYKTPHIKNKYKDSITKMSNDYNLENKRNMYNAASSSSSVLGYWLNRDNLIHAPATVKQTGDASEDLANDNWAIGYRVGKCNDFEICGQYFHRNGFLINEHVSDLPNVFNYVNTRLYFNVLKFSDVEVHLSNIIEDNDTIDTIKERLINGIRLWNNALSVSQYYVNGGGAGDYTVVLSFNGIYVGSTFTVTSSAGGSTATIINKVINTSNIVLTIRTTEMLSFTISGYICTRNNINSNVKIGDFYYDNIEKSYIQ